MTLLEKSWVCTCIKWNLITSKQNTKTKTKQLETKVHKHPPHYGLWINLYFFTMCIHKHCFLPVLLGFAMKCCNRMPCPLPHNHYCCSFPSPVCLPHLYMPHLFTHCLPTIICVMLVFYFFLVFFLIFVICYISSWFICFVSFFWAYVKPHFWLVFQIYLLVFLLFVMQSACCSYIYTF